MLRRTSKYGFFPDAFYSPIILVFLNVCQDSQLYISARNISSVIIKSLLRLKKVLTHGARQLNFTANPQQVFALQHGARQDQY
jgi:hypothetical protein